MCLSCAIPCAALGCVEEDAHALGDREVIPGCPHYMGDEGLGCGIKHEYRATPRNVITEGFRCGIVLLVPSNDIPAGVQGDRDSSDGPSSRGECLSGSEIDKVAYTVVNREIIPGDAANMGCEGLCCSIKFNDNCGIDKVLA